MLLALKILLAVASCVFICFTKKHMWARILSVCTGVSWILWMIIPHISSEIPKMSDLWQSIFWVTVFIFGYMFVFFCLALCYEDDPVFDILFRISLIGLAISLVVGIAIGLHYWNIHDSNIKREYKKM